MKLVDKMCRYEMNRASIVEDTERTQFCPQTDKQMDGQREKVKPVQPCSTSLKRGYNNSQPGECMG